MKHFSPESNLDDIFLNTTFDSIINNYDTISLKIFERLSKEKANQVYNIANNFGSILGINSELIDGFKTILKRKMKDDNIVILNQDSYINGFSIKFWNISFVIFYNLFTS